MSFFTQLSNIFGSKGAKSPKSKSREDSPTKGESESTTQTEEKTKSHMAEYIRQGETLIGFVTDLEGNLSYWENYKKISQVLEIDSNGELTLRKNCYFVHGGDVVDRGNGDIRILKDLISLHTRFPDRVFFIIGNRDANKLRFPFSLHEQVLKYKPNAFWVADSQVPADFPLNNVKEKIQWVLKATMGAPFAYENHRQELQEIFPDKEATDEAILDSFNNLIHPRHTDNLLFQYLKAGSMAVIIGDVLFVHGAVTSFQLGFVPPSYDRANNRTTETQFINDPYAWSNAINAFLKSELRDYEDSFDSYRAQIANATSWDELKELLWDTKGDYESSQPGSRLVQCGMGMKVDKSPNPGTTYASYLSNGKPVRIEEIVANWLHSGGINKVIVGHQPNGDTPLIIDHLNVLTISADSSYSKFLMWQIRDFARASFLSEADRAKLAESTTPDEFVGSDKMYTAHLQQTLPPATKPSEQANTRSALAVNEVVISFNQPVGPINTPSSQSAIGRVTVHGIISLGAEYCWSEDPFVGKETKDGWFVKAANARFHDDPRTYYVLAQSEGFNFRSKLVLASEIQNHFASA